MKIRFSHLGLGDIHMPKKIRFSYGLTNTNTKAALVKHILKPYLIMRMIE